MSVTIPPRYRLVCTEDGNTVVDYKSDGWSHMTFELESLVEKYGSMSSLFEYVPEVLIRVVALCDETKTLATVFLAGSGE